MLTRTIVLSLLALALGAGTAQAFDPQPEPPGREVVFKDGTQALIDRKGRVFIYRLAKDGTYRTRGDEVITIVNGVIAKRAGAEGAMPPKEPWKEQKGAVGTGR
jgi:hypothetical protein